MKDIEKMCLPVETSRDFRQDVGSSQVSPASYMQAYNSAAGTEMGNMTPEMYAQYAYMYNYMYMQQLAMAQTGMPYNHMYGVQDPSFGLQNMAEAQSTNKISPQNSTTSIKSKVAAHKLDNANVLISKQSRKFPKDNMNNQRYSPYVRTPPSLSPRQKDSSLSTLPSSSGNMNLNTLRSQQIQGTNAPKRTEGKGCSGGGAIDLSRKGEKLQFLNTLKQLIDSQDKLSAAKNLTNKNANSAILDLSQKSACKNRTESLSNEVIKAASSSPNPHSALSSKQDKLGYITVLKELLEKGHSSTSTKILKPEALVKSDNKNNSVFLLENKQMDNHNKNLVKTESTSQIKTEDSSEDDLDDLSVEQSLVLRNLKR